MNLIILSTIIIQSLFIGSILIFFFRDYLSILLGLLFISLAYDFFEAFQFIIGENLIPIPDISNPLLFLYGPLIYLYSLEYLKRDIPGIKLYWIFGLMFILGLTGVILDINFIYYIGYLYLIILTVSSLIISVGNRNLLIILGAFILISLGSILFSIRPNQIMLNIVGVLYIILIFFVTYLSIVSSNKKKRATYLNYRKGDVVDRDNWEKIENLLITSREYLNPDFTLSTLSRLTDFNENYISFLINRYGKGNYYKMINSLRVEEAKKLLTNKELLITDVIYGSGFNSKATFNKAFKEITEMTPRDYRKKMSQ